MRLLLGGRNWSGTDVPAASSPVAPTRPSPGQAAVFTSSAGTSSSMGSLASGMSRRTRRRRRPPTPMLPRSSITVPRTSSRPKMRVTFEPTASFLCFVVVLDMSSPYHHGGVPTRPARWAPTARSRLVASARQAERQPVTRESWSPGPIPRQSWWAMALRQVFSSSSMRCRFAFRWSSRFTVRPRQHPTRRSGRPPQLRGSSGP